MYFFWSLLLVALVLGWLPFLLFEGRRTGKYLRTFRDRMGHLPPGIDGQDGRAIWIHAVSVGEALTARPLLLELKRRFPERKIFVSTTTITGHAIAERQLADADGLFYVPFDLGGPVRRAIRKVKPALLVLMETEIWPRLIHEARQHGARVALVNGRISPRSFPRYRRVRFLLRLVLAEIDRFLMQGEAHAERVLALGAPPERVRVTGNLKFDAQPAPGSDAVLSRLLQAVAGPPLWIAGSTVSGEEALVLDAYRRVRERLPETALVLAPRHPERFDQAEAAIRAAGFSCQRRTAIEGAWDGDGVLLIDTLGELARLYPFATVVFVGGSLAAAGGHNVLEAAVAGKAVVVGPHMENFQEIANQLLAAGGLIQIASPDELAGAIESLLIESSRREELGRRAQALVDLNRGAVARTVEALAGLLT